MYGVEAPYREIVQLTWKKDEGTLKFVQMLKNIYGGYVGEHKGGFDNKAWSRSLKKTQ